MFNIQNFISNGLTGGGARPSNFDVTIFTPFGSTNEEKVKMLVTATELPSSPIAAIPIYYFGRAIKVPGNRDFPDWTVEVLNDSDFALKIMFEKWSNECNALISNRQSADPIKSNAIVTQYGLSKDVLRQYNMVGIWPSHISPIRLDWRDGNSIETYSVTFSVDYWEPVASITGNPDDYSGTIQPDGIASTYLNNNQ